MQDQFRYLLMYAKIDEDAIDRVVDALEEKAIVGVSVYGHENESRIIEVELRVDWSKHGLLTLEVPAIHGGLPGWLDRQSPETRVAGRRFADIVASENLTMGWSIELAPEVLRDANQKNHWRSRLGMTDGGPPAWRSGQFSERNETFLDLDEIDVFIRRDGD